MAIAMTAASAIVRVMAPGRVLLFQASGIERLQRRRLGRCGLGIGAAERDQPALLEASALAPLLGVSRDEVLHLRLGRHMLALEVDEELTAARIAQVGNGLLGRRNARQLDRLHLVSIFLKIAEAEHSERSGVGRNLLDEQIVILAGFDIGAVLANLGAHVLLLLLVGLLQFLHRRVGFAAFGEDQVGETVARSGRRRRAED